MTNPTGDQLATLILAAINTAREAGWQRGAYLSGLPGFTEESRAVATELADKAAVAMWRAFYDRIGHAHDASAALR